MSEMRTDHIPVPNFFIVGAPKCGTTSLSSYLRGHPDVFMTVPKEPHYFCDDLPGRRVVEDWEAYLGLFEPAQPHHAALGEASTWYLHSKVAAQHIRHRLPDARLIVMLRRQPDLLYSLHSQFLFDGSEPEQDFARAWERARSGESPSYRRYDQVGFLAPHLERLLDTFPKAQVKVLFFDDITRDVGTVYREVLRFLELSDDGRQSFPRRNASKRLRSPGLARFARKTPPWVVAPVRAVKRAMGLERIGVMKRINELNTVVAPRPPMQPALRRELIEHFMDDVTALEQLTGRDLGSWKRMPTDSA